MTVTLVEHATSHPALDGLVAGLHAARLKARFAPVATGGGALGRFDSVQHVLRHGELAPNGLLWAERAGLDVDAPVDRGAVATLDDDNVVVPLNPSLPMHREAADRIMAGGTRSGRRVLRLFVEQRGACLALGGTTVVLDRYGRPGPEVARHPRRVAARVAVIGDERLHRDVYPAVLAALGDAADGIDADLDIVFHDPRSIPEDAWTTVLREADGLVLPGGSDMEQVRGQIAVARAAIALDRPTLGLCLGLQTMATAVAQDLAGLRGASLAEADPSAPIKTFVRLRDPAGRPIFRGGEQDMTLAAGSMLARLYGAEAAAERYNHRYVLDPELHEPLTRAGLAITGWQAGRDLADGIELPGHRFFVGLQGHPELVSRPGRPHPAIAGFVGATMRANAP